MKSELTGAGCHVAGSLCRCFYSSESFLLFYFLVPLLPTSFFQSIDGTSMLSKGWERSDEKKKKKKIRRNDSRKQKATILFFLYSLTNDGPPVSMWSGVVDCFCFRCFLPPRVTSFPYERESPGFSRCIWSMVVSSGGGACWHVCTTRGRGAHDGISSPRECASSSLSSFSRAICLVFLFLPLSLRVCQGGYSRREGQVPRPRGGRDSKAHHVCVAKGGIMGSFRLRGSRG
jgi:hypothetical protein